MYTIVPKLLSPSGAHRLKRTMREGVDGFYAALSGEAGDEFYILSPNTPNTTYAQCTGTATVEASLSCPSLLHKKETKSLILYSEPINISTNIEPIPFSYTLLKVTLSEKGTLYLYAKT